MKVIIQIPCYNEEKTLPLTVADLPKKIPGVDEIEILIIDDGSMDRTREVAVECGVHHVVGFRKNRGLARAFMLGIDSCLERGADIIVNTDADNQYCGFDIVKLVEPLIQKEADMVIGDRDTATISHFSFIKKMLQKHGSMVAGRFAGLNVPDATSGFRAMTREAALELNVVSDFSYTLETLIHAGRKKLAVKHVPIRTNPKLRESRLAKTMIDFVRKSSSTMLRVYTTTDPLKVFVTAAGVSFFAAFVIFSRYLYYYLYGKGSGHIQSLILGIVLFLMSGFFLTIGILADLIAANRKLLEEILKRERDRHHS